MTQGERGRDEERLRQLFEATAEEPTGALLTRLTARAADVPERATRAPRWLPRWAWAPTFGGFAVAVGALAATFGPSLLEAAPNPALDVPNAIAPQAAPLARASASAASGSLEPASAILPTDLAEVGLLALDSDWEADDQLGDVSLEPLHGPADDADLDAWLYATAALLEDGS
jgi:hypothetical protein